jgi:hypothetical protein
MFVPICKDSHNADISKFCSRKHKDAYRRNGGMNMERLEEVVIRATIKALKEDDSFLEAIADKLRVVQAVTPADIEKGLRIASRLTGTGPIGREAAQALVDSFSPCR